MKNPMVDRVESRRARSVARGVFHFACLGVGALVLAVLMLALPATAEHAFAYGDLGPVIASWALDDAGCIFEDAAFTGNVLVNDVAIGVPHASMTATGFSVPSTGTIVTSASGDVTYTPPANWSGTATFTYKMFDGRRLSNTATLKVTVLAVNDAPVGVQDSVKTDEDTKVALNVLANDTDIDTPHASLTATGFSVPSTGTIMTSSSGAATYTPPLNWSGTATFTYKAFDGKLYSNPGVVTITVRGVNDLPVAVDDGLVRQLTKAANPLSTVSSFGEKVAVDGDTAVVSSSYERAVYVYVRRGSSWIQQQRVTPPAAAGVIGYCSSVAVDGDTIVVGDALDRTNTGAAWVFVRSGATWSLQQKLVASGAAQQDRFGNQVAIDGDTVAIAAYNDNGAGSIRVFTRSGTTWTEQATLTVPVVAGENLGYWDVDVDGDTLVAGSGTNSISVNVPGSAYVWTRVGAMWGSGVELLTSKGPNNKDFFGTQTKVDGDTIMVGAMNEGGSPGAVYVYARAGLGWTLQQRIAGYGDEQRGRAIALDGGTAVCGAPGINSFDVYHRVGSEWVMSDRTTGSDLVPGRYTDMFGSAIALSGDNVVVGAPYAHGPANVDAGSAYFFNVNDYMTLSNNALYIDPAHGILANDTDVDNVALTPQLVDTTKLHGSLFLRADGSFKYMPDPNWRGVATATYRDFDGIGYSNIATITIGVE